MCPFITTIKYYSYFLSLLPSLLLLFITITMLQARIDLQLALCVLSSLSPSILVAVHYHHRSLLLLSITCTMLQATIHH